MVTMHVRCDKNPLSYAILSKICYIGYRRFLDKDKQCPRKYRRHVFNAKHENRDAPKRLTADELQVELENTTKKYTSVMIRVCHSRSRFLSCMYIHDKFMTESRDRKSVV